MVGRLRPAFPFFVILVAVVCGIATVSAISDTTNVTFSDGWLAPTFAIFHGHPPFYPLDQGPLLIGAYGPLSFLYYLPCCLFGNSVTAAMLCGSFLSFVAFALPVGVIVKRRWNQLGPLRSVWLLLLCYLQLFFYSGLAVSAFIVHADAPAILFSTLGVLALDRRNGTVTSDRALLLSVTLTVLAAWAKQTYAAVLLLPLAVALIEKHSWRTRFLVFGWAPLFVGILFLIFSLWCGPQAVLDNMIRIPAAIPSGQATFLYGSGDQGASPNPLRSVVVAAHIQMGKFLTPYIVCFFLFLLAGLRTKEKASADRLLLEVPHLAVLFFLVTLFNLPLGAKAAINLAGPSSTDDTSLVWFFVLGVFCLIMEMKEGPAPAGYLRLDWPVYAGFLAISLISLVLIVRRLPTDFKILAHTFSPDKSLVVRACAQSPGKYYFPDDPLANYAGDGEFHHYLYWIDLRSSIGMPVSQDHFNRYIPISATVIGLPLMDGRPAPTSVLSTLVDHLQPCTGPDLPGAAQFNWYSFTRKP